MLTKVNAGEMLAGLREQVGVVREEDVQTVLAAPPGVVARHGCPGIVIADRLDVQDLSRKARRDRVSQ